DLARLAGELDPPFLEPVVKSLVADDVVVVVALDPVEVIGRRSVALTQLQPLLEGDDARSGIAKIHLTLEAVERLHLLDRVALNRRAQRLANGPQQVDEDAATEQPIDLVLARPVAT